jgi:CheY-like chemotaxis protein
VIALTASAMVENRKRCLAAGMGDYLTKPVNLAELGATLTRWQTDPAPGPIVTTAART